GLSVPAPPRAATLCVSGAESLAGCAASRAALRRPSALLSIRHADGCFRLAGRRLRPPGDVGLEQPRRPQFRRRHGAVAGGSPESPPPPRCRSRRARQERAGRDTTPGRPASFPLREAPRPDAGQTGRARLRWRWRSSGGRGMTEAEWLAGTDPQKMLTFLRGEASERKLRLFAVACCRRIGRLLRSKALQMAVEVSEQRADGLVPAGQLAKVAQAIEHVWPGNGD